MSRSSPPPPLGQPQGGGTSAAAFLLFVSATAVFSELAFVRLVTTTVGGMSYYANLLLLSALVCISAGFLATRLARFVLFTPFALLLLEETIAWLGGFNLIESLPSEFFWSTVANVYPKPADFDLQLAMVIIVLVAAPPMVLVGSLQGRSLERYGRGSSGYLLMAGGGIAGAMLFALQNQFLPDAAILYLLWSVLLGLPLLLRATSHLSRLACVLAPLCVLVTLAANRTALHFYSPYQRLTVEKRASRSDILSNGFYITSAPTRPFDLAELRQQPLYAAVRSAVRKGDRALAIGAGTGGNEVRDLLHFGAASVDAVEIDPVIAELGRRLDPEHTYDDPRVRLVINDGRRFLASSHQTYDVIWYAFADSQTVASSKTRFRLDSFLYTVEGMRAALDHLADGGILMVNFLSGRSWIQERLFKTLDTASRGKARVCVQIGHTGSTLLWRSDHRTVATPEGVAEATSSMRRISILPATDDWPFLYSKTRAVPLSHVRLLLTLSLFVMVVLLVCKSGERPARETPAPLVVYAFFSGAAFFFIELYAIAALTPVYGSTYQSQTLVIIAIIALSLLGASLRFKGRRTSRFVVWGLLLLVIVLDTRAADWFHPLRASAPLSSGPIYLVSLMLPAALSGYLYLHYLDGMSAASVLTMQTANLLGGAAGGMAECLVVLFGFSRSVWIAFLFYLLALLFAEASRLVPARITKPPGMEPVATR